MSMTQLGVAFQRGNSLSFGITPTDQLQHVCILGQTGTGKSTLLESMAMQNAAQQQGFCLIDPHGDVAKGIHQQLDSPHIYWPVADPACPYGYNLIAPVIPALRPLVAAGFIDTLRHQWVDAWGPRLENLLRWGCTRPA